MILACPQARARRSGPPQIQPVPLAPTARQSTLPRPLPPPPSRCLLRIGQDTEFREAFLNAIVEYGGPKTSSQEDKVTLTRGNSFPPGGGGHDNTKPAPGGTSEVAWHSALIYTVRVAEEHNNLYRDEIIRGDELKGKPMLPDVDMLEALLNTGASPLHHMRGGNVLAHAVRADFTEAAKTLFDRMQPELLNDSGKARQLALTGYVDFDPLALFMSSIENFPRQPGLTLRKLVQLARSAQQAAKKMKTQSTEVKKKYEEVRQRCPLVIFA